MPSHSLAHIIPPLIAVFSIFYKKHRRLYSIMEKIICRCGSSHQRCSVKRGVLRNFAKFTGKFCEISKNTFFTEHVWATASTDARNKYLANTLFSFNLSMRLTICHGYIQLTLCKNIFSGKLKLQKK